METLEDYPCRENQLEVEHLHPELLRNGRARDIVSWIIHIDMVVKPVER